MKTLFSLFVYVSLFNCCFAQQLDQNYQDRGYLMDVYDNSGNNISQKKMTDINGTPFLNSEWGTGAVSLSDGQQFANLTLQFNIQDNKLYFKQDKKVYAFAVNVSAFTLNYKDNDVEKDVIFKSGYPDHKGNPTPVLYEVVTDGPNVQFLKYLQSHVDDHYIYGMASIKKYTVSEELYLYDVKKNKLVKFSDNLKSILEALPEYQANILKFNAENNYKLNNDKSINALVTSLNYLK